MGSEPPFEPIAHMSALSRLAAIHDWKLEVLVLDDCFHQHQTFAAITTNVSHADRTAVHYGCTKVGLYRKQACGRDGFNDYFFHYGRRCWPVWIKDRFNYILIEM